MLPKLNNEDYLTEDKALQVNSRYSFLNVNAKEFVPSTATRRQESTNSVSFTQEMGLVQNYNNISSNNLIENAVFAQNLDYVHSVYNNISVDQVNNYYYGLDQGPQRKQEYSPLPYNMSVDHLKDFNFNGNEISGYDTAFSREEFSHSPYSLVDHMNLLQVTCCETNNCAIFSQSQVHSPSPLIREMQNFDDMGSQINFDKTVYLPTNNYPHNGVFSSTDTLQVCTSCCCSNNDAASVFQWQDLIPIPYIKDGFNKNQGCMHSYQDTYDTNFLNNAVCDNKVELNNITTNEISSSYTPEVESLTKNSNLLLAELKEVADIAPLQQKTLISEDTIDSVSSTNMAIKTNKNRDNAVKLAATPEINNHNIKKEAEPSTKPKHHQRKKKNRTRHKQVICSKKEHVNIVFIGHVDAGKSTLGGQLMCLTGMIDKRTINKNEEEGSNKSRESWYLSWALDTYQEERDKGKTVETGRGHFETDTKHYTILDAPGHKSFVPSMICGTAQADIAVLVLSARINEFESGFDKGGQTRDHAMLAKSAGLNVLIVVVNKMDDSSVEWNETRFNYCRDKTLPFLKKLGYATKDVFFIPISGLTGDGIMTAVSKSICPWFEGPSLIECLDKLSPITRKIENPFVMPIMEKFKDMGTVVMGKVETGSTHKSCSLLVMPNKVPVTVEQIWSDDKPVTLIKAGENVKIRLKGVEDDDISVGFVLCDAKNPITTAKIFDAHLHILDCKSIIAPGFSAVMHLQSVAENVTVTHLFCLVNPRTNEKTRKHNLQFVKKNDDAIMRIKCSGVICLTVFKQFDQLGRFTLRDDNKVIAIGKVLKIIE